MTSIAFALPRAIVVSSNDRLHWRAKAKKVADLREIGRREARAEGMQPAIGPVDVIVTIYWPDKRRRDAPNLWDTVKPLIDGIVDAGILRDDSDQYIARTIFQAGIERSQRGTVGLHIAFEETS